MALRSKSATYVLTVLLLCAALSPILSCSGSSALDASDAGKSASYQPGVTSFDIEAVSLPADSEAGFDLFISIPPPSLTFTRELDGFRALFDVTARVSNRESAEFVSEFAWSETTLVAEYDATQKFEPLILTKRILTQPGKYALEVLLEDRNSDQSATRSQGLNVIDPAQKEPAIGRLLVQSKHIDGRFWPQVSFHIPVGAESLRCAVDVYNIPPNERLPVDIRILRFKADTSLALPPHAYSIVPTPMGYGLVNLEKADTLTRVAMIASVAKRRQTLLYYIPPIREGLYRFDIRVTAQTTEGAASETSMVASRFYSIKSRGYPKPVTLHDLIESAGYIATGIEMKTMWEGGPQIELRDRFEAFWLNLAKERTAATGLIRRYYSRVEEANRLFTTVREGWRTDRGMLYIVLGPPGEILNHLDTQTWYYNLSGGQLVNTYTFKRIIREGEGLSVEEYVLYRRAYYESFWDRMVGKWRGNETF
ncbi:MAG: GWxTD domain-containing protein [Bacteroidota bacterium]